MGNSHRATIFGIGVARASADGPGVATEKAGYASRLTRPSILVQRSLGRALPQRPRAEAIIAVKARDVSIPPDGVAGRVLAFQHELRRDDMRRAVEFDGDRAVRIDAVVAEERMPVALV